MVSRTQVERVLDRLRPYLQSDGGDVEVVDIQGAKALVRLTGNCVGCPSAHLTLYVGIEAALKREIPEFEELVVV